MEAITQQFEAALAGSPALAFILVYLAGIMTSFTPCVLPLFPVAVGTITASARKREFVDGKMIETVTSKGRALLMGLFYALGLASMFSILGLVAALSGKAVFGTLASSPIAYIVLAALMALLALWLWKGDRVDPGASIQNWAFQGGEQPGILRRAVRWYSSTQGGGGATTFAFGFISGILAGPCTAPVIALVLTYVAKVGAVGYGVALMFVYAMGLATLMVVAGASATMATRLRTKGNVAQAVKLVFLAVIVGMFGYYMYQAAYFGGILGTTQAGKEAQLYRIISVSDTGAPAVKTLEVGQTLPDFSYRAESEAETTTPENKPKVFNLKDLRGKVVYLPFWGVWCKECVQEIPLVKQFEAQYGNDDQVVLLSINVLDTPERVASFVSEKKLNYPVVMDVEESLVERLGAVAMPLNLIVGPDGKIAYSGSAFPKNHKQLIDTLLKR